MINVPYNEFLFYYEKQSDSSFGNAPPGRLNVSRLIKSQPCWEKSNLRALQKKKSLIFADWAAFHWSTLELINRFTLLHNLINDDFKLYLWQDGEIVELTKDNLSSLKKLEVRSKITPVYPEELINIAVKKYGLTHDQIHILDRYWCDVLQDKNGRRTQRFLRLSEWAYARYDRNSLWSIIQQYRPKLYAIHNDEFSLCANASLNNLPSDVRVLCTYYILELRNTQLEDILKNGNISVSGKTFNLSQLDEIYELRIMDTNISNKTLQQILRQTRKLHDLVFVNCVFLDDVILDDLELPTLSYYIRRSKITAASLHNLLSHAPHLRNLDLSFSEISGTLESLHLSQLLYLVWLGNNLSNVNLMQLVSHAPKLKGVQISDDMTLSDDVTATLGFPTFNVVRSNPRNALPPPQDSDAKIIDATTELASAEFRPSRIFYPIGNQELPPVNSYRLRIFNAISCNPNPCGTKDAFKLKEEGDLSLSPCTAIASDSDVFLHNLNVTKKLTLNVVIAEQWQVIPELLPGDTITHCEIINYGILPDSNLVEIHYPQPGSGSLHYIRSRMGMQTVILNLTVNTPMPANDRVYGKQKLNLTQNWQAIASLAPNEIMTHYHASTAHDSFVIRYSNRDNQYYIRSLTTAQTITLDFLLSIPNRQPPLPLPIQQLVENYLQFSSGALVADKEEPTGEDYLRYIQEQKKGACRHRAIAFKAAMQRLHPDIPTRIIINDCHAFAEVQIQGQWIGCELGGFHTAKLIIDDSNNPKAASHATLNQNTTTHQPYPNEEYQRQLQTWIKNKPAAQSVLEYCNHLVQPNDQKKHLIELKSYSGVYAMTLNLQAYCQKISRPFFYINSPDDLICSAPFVKRQGNQGQLTRGPGGPLYDFLQANTDPVNPPVLIINYDHFTADDIVRFNTLLDKVQLTDGTPLPQGTIVIGSMNTNNPNCYQGADFYSRFDAIATCPFSDAELKQTVPSMPMMEQTDQPVALINLYHAIDWEERLLGRWIIQKDQIHFEEGELTAALATGLPIKIQNGLWKKEKFYYFWQQAILRGKIEHAGRTIILPADLKITKSEGYDWDALNANVLKETVMAHDAEVLNPDQLSRFFYCYHYDEMHQSLQTLPGLIASHAGKALHVNLTRPLPNDKRAMLLAACKQHNVTLVIHCPPDARTLDENPNTHMQVILSTDIDTTVARLTRFEHWLVLDISECDTADLLIHLQGGLNKETLRFEFLQKKQALLQALDAGERVILKGNFSPELTDGLAALLLQRRANPNLPGKLVLISADTNLFHYMPVTMDVVDANIKKSFLEPLSKALADQLLPFLETESLSKLKTRRDFLMSHPGVSSSNEAWVGLHDLPTSNHDLGAFDERLSQQESADFIKNRLDIVNSALANKPYVFLTGLSGVGKSTFVEKELCQVSDTLYQGEGALREWAKDSTSAGRKILFIDEANLSPRQWSEFEGLFHNPPGILVDGVVYPLTRAHKVVFAGNPLSCGDERKLAPLFQRHGNAIVIDPLPLAVIYEKILKPVFNNTRLEEHAAVISKQFLDVYHFLCSCSKREVLITPRELQMMALLTVSYEQEHRSIDFVAVARYYAYHLAVNQVPEQHRGRFETCFNLEIKLPGVSLPLTASEFLITPSRAQIHQHLCDVLALRHLRRTRSGNDAQLYGGLGGVILEGAPGIGKSEMVIHTLLQHGYQEIHDFNETAYVLDSAFYRMPVSMQVDDKINLLYKAFHEGMMVVIDEINSSPMMERLLNNLLMGKTPEGMRPTRPGFMIIGTQNPVTMAGRRAPSTAFARRLMTVKLPDYSFEEVKTILIGRGIDAYEALLMASAYEKQIAYAQKNHLTPAPTFRDLLRLADAKNDALISKDKAKSPVTSVQSTHPGIGSSIHSLFCNHPLLSGQKRPLESETLEDEVSMDRLKKARKFEGS